MIIRKEHLMPTTGNNASGLTCRENTGYEHEKAGSRLLAASRFRTLKTSNGPISSKGGLLPLKQGRWRIVKR